MPAHDAGDNEHGTAHAAAGLWRRVDPDPGPDGMAGAIAKAEQLTKENQNYVMPQQFANRANPAIHRATTAEEIWRDTDGKVDILVSGVGTGARSPVCQVLRNAIRRCRSSPLSRRRPSAFRRPPGPAPTAGDRRWFVPEILDTEVYDEIVKVEIR